MILFIRDNECFEPRVQNYLHYFEEHEIDYHVLAWNRNGTAQPEKNITFFQRRAEYGRRIANIPNKLAWMFFITREIWKRKKTCTIIHACDIDAVLPGLLIGRLLHKKVVFDIFDWISSLTGKGVVYKIVEFLQNFAYKSCDAVILCEEERKSQAKTVNKTVLVLPNIPNGKIKFDDETLKRTSGQHKDYEFVISYVGVFDRDRGLENLLECVSQRPNILLNIAGFGVLDDQIKLYAGTYKNICYWGRVEYAIGQTIMKNSDMIAAMYHLTSSLHKYAAPNKYYESLFLEVPMITTDKTLVGAKTKKYDTGFVLDESVESLAAMLDDSLLYEKIKRKRVNCHNAWESIYRDYYDRFMEEQYAKIILGVDKNYEEK